MMRMNDMVISPPLPPGDPRSSRNNPRDQRDRRDRDPHYRESSRSRERNRGGGGGPQDGRGHSRDRHYSTANHPAHNTKSAKSSHQQYNAFSPPLSPPSRYSYIVAVSDLKIAPKLTFKLTFEISWNMKATILAPFSEKNLVHFILHFHWTPMKWFYMRIFNGSSWIVNTYVRYCCCSHSSSIEFPQLLLPKCMRSCTFFLSAPRLVFLALLNSNLTYMYSSSCR